MSDTITHKMSGTGAACGAESYDLAISWANVKCEQCLTFKPVVNTRKSNPMLDQLARGVDCPACGAWTDTPCRTRSGKETLPHAPRIDKAVALYQAARP